jgi:medium-chain acyl-[acyl-carrier-protein] hydrolase
LVKVIADRIAPELDVPYALYGHSMGATISFELARELFRRHSTPPQHLFVSGRRAPQCPRTEPITFNLPHDEFIAELRRLNGTPREVLENPELLELFMDLLRADFELVDTYEYHPAEPLSCPITVYGGLHDKEVSAESCNAWKEQTSAGFNVRMVSGDHFFIRNPIQDFMSAFRSDVLNAVPALRKQEICDSKCS